MGYFVGDIPAQPLTIDPANDDLELFADVAIEFRDDTGAIVPDVTLEGAIDDDDEIVVTWPTTTPFAAAGVYYVGAILSGANILERLAPVPVVVDEINDGWHTLASIRERWPDAPASDIQLYELLYTAKNDVITFAPSLVNADATVNRPPSNYRKAQQMQTRNLWNASKVDPSSGGLGDGDFIVRPFPLDWAIKQVLRPKRAWGATH